MTKEKKKKIVIATDSFLPRWDGIARFLSEIILPLKEKYDITVLTSDFEGYYNDPKITIVRFPLRKFYLSDFPLSKPDKQVIKKHLQDADIVFVQSLGPIGMKSIKLAKKLKKKIYAYNHSIEWELVPNSIGSYLIKKPLHFITRYFAKKYYNMCDKLFVPTHEVSEKLLRIGVKTEKVVITLGIDKETFYPAGRKNMAKEAIGIHPQKYVIGYVGRIAREKDLKTLLRAFMRIRKKVDRAVLLIVGDGVETIKDALGSKRGVIMVGSKDNVIPYYHAMDCYVLPSLTETTSLTTLEAMSCGLPVICTKVGLIKEYIKDGVNGFLVGRRDSFSIYKRINGLIKDPLLSQKVAKKARETVIEKFSWKNTVKLIEDEFEADLKID